MTPILLSFLSIVSEQPSQHKGFIEIVKIYDSLQAIGFTPNQIGNNIAHCVEKKLIESDVQRTTQNENQAAVFRISSSGVYYIKKLCSSFDYLDAMIVDTPILDKAAGASISDTKDFVQKVNRLEIFCEYLNKQWSPLISNTFFDWAVHSKNLRSYITEKRAGMGRALDKDIASEIVKNNNQL